MAEKTCVVDAVIFESNSPKAKFCSDKCRKAYSRLTADNKALLSEESIEKFNKRQLELSHLGPGTVQIVKGEVPYDREKNLAAFIKMGMEQVGWITTGIPELDAFQRIPRGRVTQIQGPYAVGKTTLALNMLKGLAKSKQRVLYIDTEASLNPDLLVDLELDSDYFTLYNESAFIEDVYEVIIAASKTTDYDLIILDSLAATTTKTEETNEPGARNIGGKALMVNKLFRIVPMNLKNNDVALVVINQEREMIGTYVPTKYTPGGMGPLYAASLILALKTIPSWRFPKDAKNGAYKGHEIQVTVAKSKVSRPHRVAKIKLYYQEEQPQENMDVLDTERPF